ncbi:MAG: hypothetical protein HC842_03160 [Cytophagales bacterium]|nr:hypothetical protein [Cytophagales bacterium]
MVANHSSDRHPWFQAARQDPTSPYRDYYIWKNQDELPAEPALGGPDTSNRQQWHLLPGQQQAYYAYFWRGMPDLNYDNPQVRREMKRIALFWMEETQIDGYRLDAARHIYEDHRQDDNLAWWADFAYTLRQARSDFHLVGEVWDAPRAVAPYFSALPSLFNFHLSTKLN